MIQEEERQRNLIEEKMNKINLEEIKVLDRMKYTRNAPNSGIEREKSHQSHQSQQIYTQSYTNSYQSPNKNNLRQNPNPITKITARGSSYSASSGKKK